MATYTKDSPVRAELTILRPSGYVETVVWPHDSRLGKVRFDQIAKATKEAGKGDVLSYTNITPEYQMNASDLASREADLHQQRMSSLLRNSYVK